MSGTIYYDVIVVGAEPAGLMVGGLLRKMNYRVLLLDQGHPGVLYTYQGGTLPAFPVLLPPYGQAPVLDEILTQLGLEDRVHVLGQSGGISLQVITPDQRIDLYKDGPELERELNRAYPKDASYALRLLENLRAVDEQFRATVADLQSLPPDARRERKKIKRFLSAFQAAEVPAPAQWPTLLRILAAATAFLSNLEQADPPVFVTGHHVLSLLGGMRAVGDLGRQLSDAVGKAGGQVEERTVAEEILFDGKLATGVRTLKGAATFKCGSVVTSLTMQEAAELVPLKGRHRRFRQAANTVRPSRSLFSVNLVVPKSALPLGMAHHLLVVRDPAAPLEEDNLIRIHCTPMLGKEGALLVNLSCLIPFRNRNLGREYLGPLHQRLMDAVSWLVPFLEEFIQGRSSPFWDGRIGDEPHPSPWTLHQLFETEVDVVFGAAVLPAATPYKNVFCCGPEAIPGLGLEGAACAARQISRMISEKMKLRKFL